MKRCLPSQLVIQTESVVVTLLGSPADRESEGYDWIKALVQVEVGAFKGELGISIAVSDVIRFKRELELAYNKVAGVAEFVTLEEQLYMKIEVDKLGHVHASGRIIDEFVAGNRLEFNIQYDQTLLWHTIAEIDDALLQLPPPTA